MKNPLLSTVTSALLLFGVGCAGSAQYSATATVDTPQLILIEPDVQVVADYDEPVFYSENYYWRYDAGVWYRSNNHRRGWVRYEAVPARIRGIQRPTAYIRYRGEARGNGQVRDHRDHRDHQPPPPAVRDHRDHSPPPAAYQPPPPAHNPNQGAVYNPPPRNPPPAVHNPNPGPMSRDERKDVRQDAKEERKEAQQERKADRKDDRQDAKEERKEAQQERKADRKDDRQDAKEERKEAKDANKRK